MWNKEIEKQVKEICFWAYGYYRIYAKAAVDCDTNKNKMFYTTLIPNIVFALFSGIIVIYFTNREPPNWVNIINLIFNIISTVLVLLKNKVDEVNDKSSFDLLTQRNYSLFSNIRRQLAMPIDKRQQGEEYLIWITKEYDNLNNMNLLDNTYFEWYQKIADKEKLPMPGLVANFDVEAATPHLTTLDEIAKPTKSKSINPWAKAFRAANVNLQNAATSSNQTGANLQQTSGGMRQEEVSQVLQSAGVVDTNQATGLQAIPDSAPPVRIREPPRLEETDGSSSTKNKLTPNRKTFKNLIGVEDMFTDSRMQFEVSRYME